MVYSRLCRTENYQDYRPTTLGSTENWVFSSFICIVMASMTDGRAILDNSRIIYIYIAICPPKWDIATKPLKPYMYWELHITWRRNRRGLLLRVAYLCWVLILYSTSISIGQMGMVYFWIHHSFHKPLDENWSGGWLMLIDADWCWLMLIDVDLCWFVDWCSLIIYDIYIYDYNK